MKIKRGVSYCTNDKCEELHKMVFILNQIGEVLCPACMEPSYQIEEKGEVIGDGKRFTECRLEFDFDPAKKRYRGLAIVKDAALEVVPGSVYVLHSPIVKNKKRALKMAEAMLANLAQLPVVEDGQIIRAAETVLDWTKDEDEYSKDIKALEKRWEARSKSI